MTMNVPDRKLRRRIGRDLDETLTSDERVSILADCLVERLIDLKLRDRRDYLAVIDQELTAALVEPRGGSSGDIPPPGSIRSVRAQKNFLLRAAIREELKASGVTETLWQTAIARVTGDGDEEGGPFDESALDRFVAISCNHGWSPPTGMLAAEF